MENLSSIPLRNLIVTGLTRATTVIANFLTLILVARYLGPASYGYYIALYTFLTMADFASNTALMSITVRELAHDPARAGTSVTSSTIIRLGLASLGLVVYFIYIHLAHYPAEARTAANIAAFLLLMNAFQMPITVFRAKFSMQYELAVTLAARLTDIVLVIGLIFYGGKIVHFFLARIFTSSLYSLLAWILTRSVFKIRFALSLQAIRRLTLLVLPMILADWMLAIQIKTDIPLVSYLAGPVAGGLYGAIAQLPEYSLMIPDILITTVFPMLVRFYAKSAHEDFQLLYQRVFDMFMMMIVPAVVVVTLMPEDTVRLLFGAKFVKAAPALQGLIWVIALWYFALVPGMAGIAINRQKSLLGIQALGMVISLTVNIIAIPHWSYMGAVAGRAAAMLITSLLAYQLVRRTAGFSLHLGALIKILFCGALMAGVILLLAHVPRWLTVAAGSITYAIAILITCGIPTLKIAPPRAQSRLEL